MVKAKSPAKKSEAKPIAEFEQQKKRRPFSIYLIMDDTMARMELVKALSILRLPTHEYMTAREFMLDYRDNVPGVVITEYRLRDMLATELQSKLHASKRDIPIVLMISPADSGEGVKAMRHNGMDFVLKSTAEQTLSQAVWRAYAQWYDVDWDFVAINLNEVDNCMSRLTDREQQVLKLMGEGMSSREIGRKLKVSVKTVEAHRARINDKMRADDLADMARMLCAYYEDAEG
jgi:two-component system, LuxR family, response regulator FixJ